MKRALPIIFVLFLGGPSFAATNVAPDDATVGSAAVGENAGDSGPAAVDQQAQQPAAVNNVTEAESAPGHKGLITVAVIGLLAVIWFFFVKA